MKRKTSIKEKVVYSKSDRAITLIALFVTIIVLLILTGVTINMSVGNQGVFRKAKIATGEYENAEANEQAELTETEEEMDSYMPGISYIDKDGKKQILTKDTPVGTKVGTTVVDEQTLDWYLFDVDETAGKAYLVSTPTSWVPDTTKEVNGAWVPKLVANIDSNTSAIRQAIQKLANGENSYSSSNVTYEPSDNTLNYFKSANSQWSAQRGSVAFASLNENEQCACYLTDSDIFAGIKKQVNDNKGNLKGKINTLVGGASIEQWTNAYNKQTDASDSKITCEYQSTNAPGYIYKVNEIVQNSGWYTETNTIFGDDIYGAANYKGHTNSDNKFYSNSYYRLASPSSYSNTSTCNIYGNGSLLNSNDDFNYNFKLSLLATVNL